MKQPCSLFPPSNASSCLSSEYMEDPWERMAVRELLRSKTAMSCARTFAVCRIRCRMVLHFTGSPD
jgi:hypothetical protein